MTGQVCITEEPIPKVGFEIHPDTVLQTWHDNWPVHIQLSRIYHDSGGEDPTFNNSALRLDMEDICLLEYTAHREKKAEENYNLVNFCSLARKYLSLGKSLYYYGNW